VRGVGGGEPIQKANNLLLVEEPLSDKLLGPRNLRGKKKVGKGRRRLLRARVKEKRGKDGLKGR